MMKKYIVLALALTIGFSVFAQKKELKTAKKELAKGNYDKAGLALDAAEALFGSMDAKSKSKYYLSRSIFYSKSGDGQTVDADFNDLKKSIEALEFVIAKADAVLLNDQKERLRVHLINTGNSLASKKNNELSSNYFEAAYNLNTTDTIMLYYAASTAVNAKQYKRSLTIYEELKSLGFTGIKEIFQATNESTKETDEFLNEVLRDISVKAGTHTNPSEGFTDSKFPEIIKNIAIIYVQNGEDEKALEALDIAIAENPESSTLLITAANVYLRMGNTVKFKESLELAEQKDPENSDVLLNLGIIFRNNEENDIARGYFERVLKYNPKSTVAHLSIAEIIISSANELIPEINSLEDKVFYSKATKAEKKRYDLLKVKQKEFLLKASKSLEKSLIDDPDNIEYHKKLYQIFSNLGIVDKEKFHQAKYKSLSE